MSSSEDFRHCFAITLIFSPLILRRRCLGIEYLAGYTVPVGQYAVKSVMPYFMGDRLEYVSGRIDNDLGVTMQFDYGFRVDVEHVLTSSTDNLGDMTSVRLRYDF